MAIKISVLHDFKNAFVHSTKDDTYKQTISTNFDLLILHSAFPFVKTPSKLFDFRSTTAILQKGVVHNVPEVGL